MEQHELAVMHTYLRIHYVGKTFRYSIATASLLFFSPNIPRHSGGGIDLAPQLKMNGWMDSIFFCIIARHSLSLSLFISISLTYFYLFIYLLSFFCCIVVVGEIPNLFLNVCNTFETFCVCVEWRPSENGWLKREKKNEYKKE